MKNSRQSNKVKNSKQLSDRYPGGSAFGDNYLDRLRFFGRAIEANSLLHKFITVDLIVLFAKTGLGKTSLLNARIFPSLRDRDFLPISVRFNHSDSSTSSMQIFTTAIEQACKKDGIRYTPGKSGSLWEFFKTANFWRGDRLQTPVLILDQFEEIFSLQSTSFRYSTAAELGQLFRRRLPKHVASELKKGQPLPYSEKSPDVKVLISMREDYIGLLEEIVPEIPAILLNRYRLTGLSIEDAELAITEPANLDKDFQFSTETFKYHETVIQIMIDIAKNKEGNVDSFLLQILCKQIEKEIKKRSSTLQRSKKKIIVDRNYLGDEQEGKGIITKFYLDTLKQIQNSESQLRARKLFEGEKGLLTEDGRRRMLREDEIKEKFELDRKQLALLEEERLLRKELRNELFYYEISHDRLAEAILKERHRGIEGQIFKLRGFKRKYGDPSSLHTSMVSLAVKAELLPVTMFQNQREDEQNKTKNINQEIGGDYLEIIDVAGEDIIEIELKEGERIWLTVDDYKSLNRSADLTSWNALDEQVMDVPEILTIGMWAHGPVKWSIKGLKVLGVDLS